MFLIFRERFRRYKHFVKNKPIATMGLVVSAISLIYMIVDAGTAPFCVGEYLKYPMVIFVVMIYLIAKILNPTQETIVDYQLLELKLLSFWQFKVLLGIKMIAASVLLTLVCLNSYTEMVAIVGVLNVLVNIWVFLRNRWNNRIYDLAVAGIVMVCIKGQFLYMTLLSGCIFFLIFVLVARVNYAELLPLYKLTYKISQQRYMGVVYSAKETRDIETSAETLLGKPKKRNSLWCSKFYEKKYAFELGREVVRIYANRNRFIAYFITNLMVGIGRFYIPQEYDYIIFVVMAFMAVSFDMMMNQREQSLLLRGFIEKYSLWGIIKKKIPVYSICNFILMVPTVMLGWKWLAGAGIVSVIVAMFVAFKCFGKKI